MSARLLIAAGDAATRVQDLPFGIRQLIASADEVLVIAPTLPTRWEWLSSATDTAREQADERLEKVLGQVSEIGGKTKGTVGADDPLLAFEDAIAEFQPDHILIGLRAGDSANWQETGLMDQVLERFAVPVTAFHLRAR